MLKRFLIFNSVTLASAILIVTILIFNKNLIYLNTDENWRFYFALGALILASIIFLIVVAGIFLTFIINKK
jgi:hypothetical protein